MNSSINLEKSNMIERSKKSSKTRLRYLWQTDSKTLSLPNESGSSYIPLQIQNYEILDIIGEGANGVVLKAKNISLDRVDAVKIWLPNRKRKNEKVCFQQYLAEVRKIAKLKNSGIVSIYNAWEQNGYYLAATEFVDGFDLKNWVSSMYNSSETLSMDICSQLLNTVLFYQCRGFLHGDIHSGNILIDKNNKVHLIDFGTSFFAKERHDENLSAMREMSLLYEDVKLLLGNRLDESLLSLKFIEKLHQKQLVTKNLHPILLTKTLLQYLKMLSVKDKTVKIMDREILEEYCASVAGGFYFNLSKVIEDLLSFTELKNAKNFALGYLNAAIFNNVFLENKQYHQYDILPDQTFTADEIEVVSAYVYFEFVKRQMSEKNMENTKNEFFTRYKGFLDDAGFEKIWLRLKQYENVSLLEYMDGYEKEMGHKLKSYSSKMENIRCILYTLLVVVSGDRYIDTLYKLWLRITEVRFDKELHQKIMDSVIFED